MRGYNSRRRTNGFGGGAVAPIKTVTIEYGRVVNHGDYNSQRTDFTLGAELDEGEDVDDALAAGWEKVRESVRAR